MNAHVKTTTTMSLEERALLVKLSFSSWSATKTDKMVTAEVAENKNAQSDAGRYSKNLVSKEALKKINSIISAARQSHYTLTLPWNDDGARIITTETYQHYSKTMRTYRVEMETAVNEFLDAYEEHVKASKSRLGKMFNLEDYPAKEAIRYRFRLDVEPTPIPVSKDFRAKVSNAEAAAIAKDIERRTKERLDNAMKEVWGRIAKLTEHMAEKLKEYDPGNGTYNSVEGIFRDSLVSNIRELADVLPALNIANDPNLVKIHKDITDRLCVYEPKVLREDEIKRLKTAKAAKQIFDRVSQYMA